MTIGKNMGEGLIWGQIGMSVRTLISFAISIVVARVLGVENYGVYAVLISLVELLIKVTDMGIYTILTTYIPRLLHSGQPGEGSFLVRRTLLGRNLLIVLTAVLFVGFAKPLTTWMGTPDILEYLTVTMLLFLVRGFMDGFNFTVMAQVDMKYYSAVEIGVSVLQALGVFVLIKMGIDVGRLMGLMILINSTQCLLYGVRSLPVLKPQPEAIPLAGIWKFGLTVWFGTLLRYFRFKSIDVLMLMYFLQDRKAVAYYEVAYILVRNGGNFLSTAINRLALPLLSQAQTRFGAEGMGETWGFLTKLSIYLTAPIFVFLIAHAEGIVHGLYSEPYAPTIPFVQMLSIFSLLSVCLAEGTAFSLFFPLNKERVFVSLSAFNGLLNFGSALILIPLFGVMGVVIATGGSALITDCIALLVARRETRIRFPFGFVFQTLVFSVVGVYCTFLPGELALWQLVPAALVYAVIVTGLILRFHQFNAFEKTVFQDISPRVFNLLLKYGLLR